MRKSKFIIAALVLIFNACSSTDENTIEPIKEEDQEVEETDNGTLEETGADLLFNGTAIMETGDARIPYIFYNQTGVSTSVMDENLDGELDKIILKDDDAETVIEMNTKTGLPKKMYTSEGILVIYNFKDENSLLDLAVVTDSAEIIYIDDVNISDSESADKNTTSNKSLAAPTLEKVLFTIANGYRWSLGSWCKIKQDGNIVFQSLNLTVKECREIYREMHPCCNLPAYQGIYSKQLQNQTKVLSEIEELIDCAKDGNVQDCITDGLVSIQDIVNEASSLRDIIGEELILQAENVLFNIVENNPGGNTSLLGTWLLDRQEEVVEGTTDITLVGTEYCDDFPNQNSCYTITETSLVFNEDGTFISTLNELDKQEGPNGPAKEIVEKEIGKWSYNTETNELLLVALNYEYSENGILIETDTYANGGEIIYNESFTILETELFIIFDSEDNNADGIVDESYTEYYMRR